MSSNAASDEALPLGKAAKSLPELLAERILEAIMAGRLEPGHRLKELALAREHAVSRATVREALIALSKRGYVEQIPRFGARVAPFAKEDVFDLYEIRAALLAIAARRCALAPDAPRQALAALVSEMEALVAAPDTDPMTFSERSIAAQALLVGASGNRRLPALYEHLSTIGTWRLIRGRATSFLRASRWRESATDWRQIETAIRLGDADAAEAAAQRLMAHSAAAVRAELQGSSPE
ncbi:GntR family transcriptional regulator [Vineibacter terrae]|uniref:GntR family transcriptional regulator n=1 Tax=Vineibacter terrae TaxID=2586908 RepID=A0A5C8PK73_9HYPH|nr:GntR family transcriptional regulator [Vineibacter terrae]TXL74276.1 GntR family transcriptional regulator [Vineibacter terrae]